MLRSFDSGFGVSVRLLMRAIVALVIGSLVVFGPGFGPQRVAAGSGTSQPPRTTSVAGVPESMYSNLNIYQVFNDPTAPTVFTITTAWLVTEIIDYHWNYSQGATPLGTIALSAANGTVIYGPWQVHADVGLGELPNTYWAVNPNVVIPAGTYTVVDSSPETWSQNAQSGGAGMSWGTGIKDPSQVPAQVVDVAATPDPAEGDDWIQASANVLGMPPSAPAPTGTLTFFVDGIEWCHATLIDHGIFSWGSCSAQGSLPVGSRSVAALYGGDDAFQSAVSDVYPLEIIASINDAPSASDNTVTTPRNTSYTFSTADFGFNDGYDSPPNNLLEVEILNLPAHGTLTLDGNPIAAPEFVSATDIDAGLLVFTPAAGATGIPYASFDFQVRDDGGTANGGVDLSWTAHTITIDVTFLPSVTTDNATNVTGSSAQLNGTVNPNGFDTGGWFRWDNADPGACNDSFGIRIPSLGDTPLGDGLVGVAYSAPLTGLAHATTYYYCAIAASASGRTFGTIQHFTTANDEPDTAITSGPDALTSDNTPTFEFSTTTTGATFECQLDGGAYAACTSPHTTSALIDGAHSFSVRAVNAGVADSTPAQRAFTVDTVAPTIAWAQIAVREGGVVSSAPLLLSWQATHNGASDPTLRYEWQVRRTYVGLPAGPWVAGGIVTGSQSVSVKSLWRRYEYRVRSQDQAGNWSAWEQTHPIRVVRRDDFSFDYTGSWTRLADKDALRRDVMRSSTPGSTARLRFSGHAIALVMPAHTTMGVIKVCLDPTRSSRQCRTVDLATLVPNADRQLVIAFTELPVRHHVIKVTVVSGTIDLDGALAQTM